MTRYDYYFTCGWVVSWYNKKMPKRELTKYEKEYGPLKRVVKVA